MNESSSFKKVFEYKKYKDLFDYKSATTWISFVGSVICTCLFFKISKDEGIGKSIQDYASYLDGVAIALIGFLGFIVTGLAILTSAISSKMYNYLCANDKLDSLERILLSFYLLGMVSATTIVVSLVVHFIVLVRMEAIVIVIYVIIFLISYLVLFAILYAVKLIGNCLDLLNIINAFEFELSKLQGYNSNNIESETSMKDKYNNYRITAIEKAILSSGSVDNIKNYQNDIKKLIENDTRISDEEKNGLLEMNSKQFKDMG